MIEPHRLCISKRNSLIGELISRRGECGVLTPRLFCLTTGLFAGVGSFDAPGFGLLAMQCPKRLGYASCFFRVRLDERCDRNAGNVNTLSFAGFKQTLRQSPDACLADAQRQKVGVRSQCESATSQQNGALPYAHTMVDAEERAFGELRPAPDEIRGVLRMTAPSVFGQSIVMSVLPQLLEQYPELSVELDVSDRLVDIVAGGLDLALRIAPLADSELIARRVAPNPRVLCAAPAYLNRRGSPANLADLDQHQCILLQAVSQWPFVIDGEVHRRRMNGRLNTSSVDAVRTAATQGLGVAMLTYWDIAHQLKDGSLVEIKLDDAQMEALCVWAVTPTRRYVPACVKAFLSVLHAHMKMLAGFPAIYYSL